MQVQTNKLACGTICDVKCSQMAGATHTASIAVPAAARNGTLVITTFGGNGDLDLFVKFGSKPTRSTYDAKSTASGVAKRIPISSPPQGIYTHV